MGRKKLRKDLPNILDSPLEVKRIGDESLDWFVRESKHGRTGDEGNSGFVEVSGTNQAIKEGRHLQDVHSEGLYESEEDVEVVRKRFCVLRVGRVGPTVHPKGPGQCYSTEKRIF